MQICVCVYAYAEYVLNDWGGLARKKNQGQRVLSNVQYIANIHGDGLEDSRPSPSASTGAPLSLQENIGTRHMYV